MKDFKNKVVWVTGASSGIGEALVKLLATSGAIVILSSRREEVLKKIQQSFCDPMRSDIVPLDLESGNDFSEIVASVIQKWGRIDCVIHNGGVSQRSLVRDTNLSVYRRIMDINYMGTVALTLATLPHFRSQGYGKYVVITSIVGKIGTPLRSGYAASKHALHGFFDSLRAEEYDSGIRVLIVLPGYIRTLVSVNALTGDGSPQGTMDPAQENGIPPEECAGQILKGILSKREELIIARPREKLAIYLKRFLPSLLSKILRKAKVT